jgi:L-alanine-DL-glutamate epimerase-like enolase superfamily enzyme
MVALTLHRESWPLRGSFTISRGTRTTVEVVVAEISDGDARGRGECVPYARYGESVDSVLSQIEGLRDRLSHGLDREGLQSALPPGAARNALDCAFWDLEAKRAGQPAWAIAGLDAPEPLLTAYTLSLDTAENMRRAAAENAERPLLKLKLAGPDDFERVQAVREGAPRSRLVVDANEAWTADLYRDLAPRLKGLGVEMIEQPLHADRDAALEGLDRPVALCADESCHDRASLPGIAGRYDMVNIKLDKTGGLTEALKLKAEAEAAGYAIMVGCMLGTSLAMAPALLVAQGAAVVDLDGPLLLSEDRPEGLRFEGSTIHPPQPELWG